MSIILVFGSKIITTDYKVTNSPELPILNLNILSTLAYEWINCRLQMTDVAMCAAIETRHTGISLIPYLELRCYSFPCHDLRHYSFPCHLFP